mgnify:CR=1 FL=1
MDDVLFWMADEGRLGRKSASGFYGYDDTGKRTGLWDGLADKYPAAEAQPELAEVQHRLLFAQVLEAVRALESDVLTDIREGDVGAILGWGAVVLRAVRLAVHPGRGASGGAVRRAGGPTRRAVCGACTAGRDGAEGGNLLCAVLFGGGGSCIDRDGGVKPHPTPDLGGSPGVGRAAVS